MASTRPLAHLINNPNSNRSSTSLITPAVSSIADPPTAQVDANLFDLLTAEVVRMMINSEAVARQRLADQDRLVHDDLAAQGLDVGKLPQPTAPTSRPGEGDDGVRSRLEQMGYSAGWTLAERLSLDRPRLPPAPPPAATPSTPGVPPPQPAVPTPDVLEAVKFVCKDVWISLYDKQIDNLRTNHRGVYVLHDNGFRPVARISGEGDEVNRRVRFLLAFPCGVIRGALANLGVACTVTAESQGLPQSTFQIKTVK